MGPSIPVSGGIWYAAVLSIQGCRICGHMLLGAAPMGLGATAWVGRHTNGSSDPRTASDKSDAYPCQTRCAGSIEARAASPLLLSAALRCSTPPCDAQRPGDGARLGDGHMDPRGRDAKFCVS